MKTNLGRRMKPFRSIYERIGTTRRRPYWSYCSTSRDTKPERLFGMNNTVPVTISGFWYSSPIRFQYVVLANSRSYGSRSFSSLIFAGRGWLACSWDAGGDDAVADAGATGALLS